MLHPFGCGIKFEKSRTKRLGNYTIT